MPCRSPGRQGWSKPSLLAVSLKFPFPLEGDKAWSMKGLSGGRTLRLSCPPGWVSSSSLPGDALWLPTHLSSTLGPVSTNGILQNHCRSFFFRHHLTPQETFKIVSNTLRSTFSHVELQNILYVHVLWSIPVTFSFLIPHTKALRWPFICPWSS